MKYNPTTVRATALVCAFAALAGMTHREGLRGGMADAARDAWR